MWYRLTCIGQETEAPNHLIDLLTTNFDCVNLNKLWKIFKEIRISDHLTSLLRNLVPSQEATVRTGYGTTKGFHIGKGVYQSYKLSPNLFKLYAEYIM